MKRLLVLLLAASTGFSQITNAQTRLQDSLALVDLYNSTNGPLWLNHTNWLTSAPLDSWYGITMYNDRVLYVVLGYNHLTGVIPPSIANLSQMVALELNNNELTGTIPSTLGNNAALGLSIFLEYNLLTGEVPASLSNIKFGFARVTHNNLNFDGLEFMASHYFTAPNYFQIECDPANDLRVHKTGNTYAVTAGGTLSKNTYKWYDSEVLVATVTGDSTFTTSAVGQYNVEVSNNVITSNTNLHLTLYSNSSANLQDSLALVDLYNSTNGGQWIVNTNWLSAEPLSNWYGVTVRRGRVVKLDLNSNNLVGNIPSSIGNLTKLTSVELGRNQLTGNLPVSFGNDTSLIYVNLALNRLTGTIPTQLINLPNLTDIYLSINSLTGSIPEITGSDSKLHGIFLTDNQLQGNLPGSLGKCSNLTVLEVSNNQMSGAIPDSLYNCTLMSGLGLSNNYFTGKISDSIMRMQYLSLLGLRGNQFTGKLPDSISTLSLLGTLDISYNQFSDTIPASLKNLLYLDRVFLDNNQFTFSSLESLPAASMLSYAPQATRSLLRKGNLFSLTAGGTLSNNTYHLFRNGVQDSVKTGDSTFVIARPGNYYVTVTNSLATALTLSTDTIIVNGLRLADSTTNITTNISGVASTDITDIPDHNLILSFTPNGASPVTGDVNFKVTLDPAVNSYNGQPYVQRHYDITPTISPATSQARVKLYFTQTDFDNFNSTPAHGLNLPTGTGDATGIANLRIYQYHGFSATSLPGSYAGNAVEIDPADADIVWNAASHFWEVSFDVTGFSGFFVSSQNSALLPVHLLSFTGTLQKGEVLLNWTSSAEINSQRFEIERSFDGNAFTKIGTVTASGNTQTNTNYHFTDVPGLSLVYYYRLRMVDRDGNFNYSKTIKLLAAGDGLQFKVSPNPASNILTIQWPSNLGSVQLLLVDATGKTVRQIRPAAGVQQVQVAVKGLSPGAYQLLLRSDQQRLVRQVEIQ